MNMMFHGYRRLIHNTVICLALLFGVSSQADSWSQPREFDAFSENGKFVAHVTPGKKDLKPLLIVSSINGDKTNQIWKTELSNHVSPTEVFLSDDGESAVTLDNWFRIGFGDDVVAIYRRNGQMAKFSLEQFAPPPLPAKAASGGLLVGVYGGYDNRFRHSTSSRNWRENSIQFFYSEAGQRLFCLWLDWDVRWVAWRMNDGKLLYVTGDQTKHLNVEGRRRALEQAVSVEFSSAAMNFLGRMRFKEDRPLVEAWLHDAKFSGGSMQSYPSERANPEFTFTAHSWKREAADRILTRWDEKDSKNARLGSLDEYRYLGTLKCAVVFAIGPAKKEGALRVYLIPETTPLNHWATERPAHYLIANLDHSYPYVFENGRSKDGILSPEVNFIIYGVTPGKYRVKALWDKAAPFASEKDVICLPKRGDYESTASPVVLIRQGAHTEGVRIECKKLVVK